MTKNMTMTNCCAHVNDKWSFELQVAYPRCKTYFDEKHHHS